ncbi:UNVERIFIED_CONTAM: heparinase II/III family protein [Halobacillus marinus]
MNEMMVSGMTEGELSVLRRALPRSRNKDFMKAANTIVNKNAYSLPPFGVIPFNHLVDWDDKRSRSFERLIHGHTFIGCLMDAYKQTDNATFVDKARALVMDWIQKHHFHTHKDQMAYHDETTALRLQHWISFHLYAGDQLEHGEKVELEKRMWSTAALLADEDFHSTNTNHGMFQDISLLLFSIYFKTVDKKLCTRYKKLAIERLDDYFSSIFTSEGVHKEHSPSYHMLVSNYVRRIVDWLSDIDSEVSRRFLETYQKTEEFSNYILYPDGKFPPICDTESKPVSASSYKRLYNSPEYQFSSTGGRNGTPPKEIDKVFPESGYAVFRDSWEKKEKATYVLFSAAYHADYHKHSDDLNMLIYSDGEIITEAGPNGYNYKDPHTKYAYSSYAHNTLIVDGKGLPRTDGQYDKVSIIDHAIGKDSSEVTGINKRYNGTVHTRTVKYKKSQQQISVDDVLTSEDQHEYKLLWHVAADIEVHVRDRFVEFYRKQEKVAEMEVNSNGKFLLNKVSGETQPEVKGWKFPVMEKKEKNTCVEVSFGGRNVEVNTTFRLSNFKLQTPEYPMELEEHFESNRNLKYHFKGAEDPELADRLLVVFSAMSPRYKFVYNYMNTLDDIKTNKLFILDDFGDQGSYYIGENRDYSIETAVSSLIQYHASKLNIVNKNVTTIGTSKGGFAALYFGLKYYFGTVITGAPQTKLGHFLINQADHPNIAEYISGGAGESDRYYLDQLLYQLLRQNKDVAPNIEVLVGKSDHHYPEHVMPFYKALKDKGYQINLETADGLDHKGLREHFPPFLSEKVRKLFGMPISKRVSSQLLPVIKSVMLSHEANKLIAACEADGQNLQYAYYIYREGNLIEKIPYKRAQSSLTYEPLEDGHYMVRIYVRSKDNKIAKNTNEIKFIK